MSPDKQVPGAQEKAAWGLDHPRAGELVAVAEPGHWFPYYYWLDDAKAPDFARIVDIHRKPGYDPVELFLDPRLPLPRLKIAWRLLQRRLGQRVLLDLIPLRQAGAGQGHPGRQATSLEAGALLIGSDRRLAAARLRMTEVRDLVLKHFV